MNKSFNFLGKVFKTNNYIIDKMMNTWEFDYKIEISSEKSNNIFDSKLFWIPFNPIWEVIPKNSNWEDLQLLIQINLEDLNYNEKLPKNWFLQFFIHSDYIYGLMDNKYNNLVVRYIEKQDISNHDEDNEYKIFYDNDRKEYWNSDWYKLLIYKDIAYLSPNCQELTNIINIHPYEVKFIHKISSLMDEEYSWFLYNKAIKNRLFWFPFFIQNEIRQDELFWYPYNDHSRNKSNIHKWFKNLLTFNFDDKIKLKSYWWENIMLNILIHEEDLKKLKFDNLLHELDCT